MRQLSAVCMLALFALPAAASQPGQPLDCSDWVFLEPGLTCSDYNPYPDGTDTWWRRSGDRQHWATLSNAIQPADCGNLRLGHT
jgi:hypothetical protein